MIWAWADSRLAVRGQSCSSALSEDGNQTSPDLRPLSPADGSIRTAALIIWCIKTGRGFKAMKRVKVVKKQESAESRTFTGNSWSFIHLKRSKETEGSWGLGSSAGHRFYSWWDSLLLTEGRGQRSPKIWISYQYIDGLCKYWSRSEPKILTWSWCLMSSSEGQSPLSLSSFCPTAWPRLWSVQAFR